MSRKLAYPFFVFKAPFALRNKALQIQHILECFLISRILETAEGQGIGFIVEGKTQAADTILEIPRRTPLQPDRKTQ